MTKKLISLTNMVLPGAQALSASMFFIRRPKLIEAGSDFKSLKLVIEAIPIKHMYLERLPRTLTGH